MNANANTARAVGALFWLSNITFIAGAVVLVESILGAPDYLALASASRTQLVIGVLLELINGLAYVGIALLLFPLLKQRHESLALGYVALRLVEFVLQIAGDLGALSLLALSADFVSAGAPASGAFQAVGTMLLAERYWAFQMLSFTFSLSALMLYFMLYQSGLVPRFIAVWGLIGAAFVLANTLAAMLGVSLGAEMELVLGLPMLLNELFLGGWLIARGFQVSALAPRSAYQT